MIRHSRLIAAIVFVACLLMGVGLLVAGSESPGNDDESAFLGGAAVRFAWIVDLSAIAAKQTATKEVNDYAGHVGGRYSARGKELKELAGKKKIVISADIDDVRQNTTAYMAGRRGAALDREYVSAVADELSGGLKRFRREARTGRDGEIRKFAAAMLKEMEEDLARAERILKDLPQPILK